MFIINKINKESKTKCVMPILNLPYVNVHLKLVDLPTSICDYLVVVFFDTCLTV